MKNKLPLIWKNIFQAQGFLGREVSKKKKKSQMYSDGQKLESGSMGVSKRTRRPRQRGGYSGWLSSLDHALKSNLLLSTPFFL